MKVAYATIYDSSDIRAWSGLGYYIKQNIKESGLDVVSIDKLRDEMSFLKVKSFYYRILMKKGYQRYREPLVLKSYARQVQSRLKQTNADIVFSPSTLPLSYLETDLPIIFWVDATFAGMTDFYPGYFNLCNETIRDGYRTEQLALNRCKIAIYASNWAAQSAIDNYLVDIKKVKIVPFGANLEITHSFDDVRNYIKNRNLTGCKLLFLGIDWERKGGPTALQVAADLNRRGLRTELHVVGCRPPKESPSYVIPHGFISKHTSEGMSKLTTLLKESHFLILPSRAECFGVVFAEASAFGLPSLATNVGGIPSAITDGVNGKLFSLAASPEIYSDYILDVFSSEKSYEKLALSSFDVYKSRLNWNESISKVKKIILENIE